MRPPDLIHRLSVIQLDIQILIDALQRPTDLDFILELHGDFVLDEGLEETAHMSELKFHTNIWWCRWAVRRRNLECWV